MTGTRCGYRVTGTEVLTSDGAVAYRDPSKAAMWHQLKCSGPAVWVVFVNGVGMMHEEYIVARSVDRGRTWRRVLTDAPGQYSIGAEVGVWTLQGSRKAYFVGACPACGTRGQLFLSVTKDGGRTFRSYLVPSPPEFGPLGVHVSGTVVTIPGKWIVGKVDKPPYEIYRHRTLTVHVA